MASGFVRMVYAFLTNKGVDTKKLTPAEAISLYHQITKKSAGAADDETQIKKAKHKQAAQSNADKLRSAIQKLKVDRQKHIKYNKTKPGIADKKDKYVGVLERVKSFSEKDDGTYDYATGDVADLTDRYMVTFHQNEPDESGHYKSHFGRYNDDEYDRLTNEIVAETGAEVFISVYDNEPEVTFKVKTFEQAKRLMEKHNQDSLWDNKKRQPFVNWQHNKSKNPMRGD